jgi:DNA helicase HerA-like ATPase
MFEFSATEARSKEVRVARVLGTEDSTPLEFWVALERGHFLQLDDLVALERKLPDGRTVRIFGVVTQVRTRHEGARFDTDVFLIEDGILPAEVSEAAKVLATRFDPEVFVPPWPGQQVYRATGDDRDLALYADGWEERLPIGLSRNDEPVYANLEFLDGRRGAHVNISGVSGVATKSTYALFLLFSLFESGALGADAINTRSLVFNVKGEDLLFLDRANKKLTAERAERYRPLGLPARPFGDVSFWAPARRGVDSAAPDVSSRTEEVTSYFWTVHEFCKQDLLPFLFADAEDERAQYPLVLHNVLAQLRKAKPYGNGAAVLDLHGAEINIDTYDRLVEHIAAQLEEDPHTWAGPAIGQGTINAFVRRLYGSLPHVRHLVRGDVSNPDAHRISLDAHLSVVDIHNLHERGQRFVVGAVLRKAFEDKERSGGGKPLLFVVLDELNKYAPREGSSPIKEILLDIAERGRSLGIILIGAQQTASEVERRVVANSSLRVVGRLDSAEATREEYRFLPDTVRQRATILKPGTMIVSQPELPVPLVVEFPFPAWATRPEEAVRAVPAGRAADPFEGLV